MFETIPTSEKSETIFAHWGCDLNAWKWPEDWGEPPDWIKDKFKLTGRERHEFEKDRYSQLTSFVLSMTTPRERYRVHNVVRRRAMTEEQFEEWWKAGLGKFIGGLEA